MSYPKIEMHGSSEFKSPTPEQSQERTQRIADQESDLLKKFEEALPKLPQDQAHRLMPIIEEIAEQIINLQDESGYDQLTQLYNRRGFYRRLENEFRRHARALTDTTASPSNLGSLLYIDIDYFGAINKSFGDEEGDEVLRKIGKIFGNTRPEDAAARWGGEEFLIYVPDDLTGAVLMGKRLQERTAEIALPDESNLTLSIGISQISPEIPTNQLTDRSILENKVLPQYINQASVAMRKGAKERGRNKIAVMNEVDYIQSVIFEPDPINPARAKITFQPVTGT